MKSGLGLFIAGLFVGVVGTLLALRIREWQEEDADDLTEDITRRLDEMEALLN